MSHEAFDSAPALLIPVGEAADLQAKGAALFLDATYFAASEPLKAAEVFAAGHIPGAQRFDVEAVARAGSVLPHTVPTLAEAEALLLGLGLKNGQRVVIYDRPRLRSAPRAWWLLRHFGIEQVQILDGGYDAWVAAGLPVARGEAAPVQGDVTLHPRAALLAELPEVIAAAESGAALILDARPADRFSGETGDGWTKRRGHIRGSINLPASKLLTAEGRLKPVAELEALLAPHLDGRPVITTCGSGIAAATLAFALAVIGREAAVFDGSWAEWGNAPLTEALTATA